MKAVNFEAATKTLVVREDARLSTHIVAIDPLRVWTDGEQCVSCWKMSLRERLHVLFRGYIWVAILSGSTQPPVALEARREYLPKH